MKKFKKVISLLVVMVMVLSLIPQTVLAAQVDDSYLYGWERADGLTQNGSTVLSCVTSDIAHSGSNSLLLKHEDESQYGSDLKIRQIVDLGEGTYTLSFWATGTVGRPVDDPWRNQQMVWLWGSSGDWFYIADMDIGDTDGDWTKYSKEFTVESGKSVYDLGISIRGYGATGLFLDDISIVKSGTTNNILKNGSFDFNGNAEYTNAYEAYFTGWGRNGGVTSNTTNVFACVTNKIAHSGNNSVVLKHTDSTQGGYMQIQQTSLSLSEGTYTLSFWVAGEVNGQQVIWIKPGTTTANGDWLLLSSAATGETDGDWTKYSTTFNVASGNTVTELTIGTSGNTNGLYIDDISIVKAGTTSNLVKNGSFDFNGSAEYTDAYEAYFTGWDRGTEVTPNESTVFACVTNAIAHSGSNSVALKHSNANGYIQIQQNNLSLGEGTYTLSFWAAGEVNDGQTVIWIKPGTPFGANDWSLVANAKTNEVEGAWTKYSTTFTVESGEGTVTQLMIGTQNTPGLYLDDISIVAQGDDTNLLTNGGFEEKAAGEDPDVPEVPEVPEGPTYTTALDSYFQGWEKADDLTQNGSTVFSCVTNEIAHSGSNSVLLKHEDESQYGKDLKIRQIVNLGEGTYTLSFWAAGTVAKPVDDAVRYQQMVWLWGSSIEWSYISNMTIGETDGDWTKYSIEFTVPSGNSVYDLGISIRGWASGLYLDDISIVKSGTTNNILKNGSFDFDGNAEYTNAYEGYFTGWARNGGVTSNTTTVFACVTDKIAHSGNNSVVLKHTDSTQGGYIQIQQTTLSLVEGTYTLSFWVAGEVNGQQVIWIKPGTTTANGDWLLINSAATGETDGDWTKYSTTFNVASGNTVTELTIGTNGNTNGLYLDDISITAMGEPENLVKNGSFDFNGSVEYTDAYEAYFTGWERGTEVTPNESTVFACVTNEIAHSGSNSVALKHTDSTQGGYIQIQQNNLSLGEGTYTLSFWAAGEVNDGQTVIWIKPGTPFGANDWSLVANAKTNEVEGAWTKYSTTFTVESGEGTVTQLMIGIQNTPGLYLDDFSIVKSGETENLVKNGGFEQKGLRGYYVSTPKVVKIEGENRRELTALESGNLEISLEVANYSMGDNFAPILIVALYNGGTLESMEFVQQGTSESALDGFLEDEISFTVEVPEMTAATAYQLKVMCWDNWSTLTPLVDALELE